MFQQGLCNSGKKARPVSCDDIELVQACVFFRELDGGGDRKMLELSVDATLNGLLDLLAPGKLGR